MKAMMLDFLINLFSEQMSQIGAEGGEIDLSPEKAASLIGGTPADLITAMAWLSSLHKSANEPDNQFKLKTNAVRAYLPSEVSKVGGEGIAFLDQMVAQEIVTPAMREVIVHHCLMLDTDTLAIVQLKWIVFMTLAATAQDIRQLAWLDYLVLLDNEDLELTVH